MAQYIYIYIILYIYIYIIYMIGNNGLPHHALYSSDPLFNNSVVNIQKQPTIGGWNTTNLWTYWDGLLLGWPPRS